MPNTKVHAPDALPAQGVTEEDFNIWAEELVIFLIQNDAYENFLEGGLYSTWEANETYAVRIRTHAAPDNATHLAKRRKELRTFLGHIVKSCHKNDFQSIMRHSTSFKWILDQLRENYDIQQKGIHFLNIVDIRYDPTSDVTPTAFYNHYRAHILSLSLIHIRRCRRR